MALIDLYRKLRKDGLDHKTILPCRPHLFAQAQGSPIMKRIAIIALLSTLSLLAACGSDFCSPFDKPQESAQPVEQGDSSK